MGVRRAGPALELEPPCSESPGQPTRLALSRSHRPSGASTAPGTLPRIDLRLPTAGRPRAAAAHTARRPPHDAKATEPAEDRATPHSPALHPPCQRHSFHWLLHRAVPGCQRASPRRSRSRVIPRREICMGPGSRLVRTGRVRLLSPGGDQWRRRHIAFREGWSTRAGAPKAPYTSPRSLAQLAAS
jgi:hypothetical protein